MNAAVGNEKKWNILALFDHENLGVWADKLVESLYDHLKEVDVHVEFISGLDSYDDLKDRLQTPDYDWLIVAQGGASALLENALKLTPVPVLALPLPLQYGGVDSFLSMTQLSQRDASLVATPGERGIYQITHFLAQAKNFMGRGLLVKPPIVNVVASPELQSQGVFYRVLDKARSTRKDLNIGLEVWNQINPAAFNLVAISEKKDLKQLDAIKDEHVLGASIPMFSDDNLQLPERAFSLFEWGKRGGLWVGSNQLEKLFRFIVRFGQLKNIFET